MTEPIRKERSPGVKLLLASLIGLALVIPLMMVYALVWEHERDSGDRAGQSHIVPEA